jgi:DNA-directed RNA polymerase subunit RPC12/RpoP
VAQTARTSEKGETKMSNENEKCPKCGAGVLYTGRTPELHRIYTKYTCNYVAYEDGGQDEAYNCIRRQLTAAQKENERLREGLGVLADVSVFLADLSAELQASDHLSDKFKQTSVLALLLAVDKARARFGGERRVLKITDPPKPWSPCKPGPDGKCVECGRPVSDAARALLGEEARDE